jgi:cytochrome o ubiquinol oxidase subunit III
MTHPSQIDHESYPDTHHGIHTRTIFGFWLYLLTDFILFASFFATYAVLYKGTYGGPSGRELFHLPVVLLQTFILLTSSFTSGLAGALAHRKNKMGTIILFFITFLLGLAFTWMEFDEFARFVHEGNSWKKSAFLSAFFTLVGAHGIHMCFAMLWVFVLLIPVFREGLTSVNIRRLTCLRMFWQFLNVVWVFIFTMVYMGATCNA